MTGACETTGMLPISEKADSPSSLSYLFQDLTRPQLSPTGAQPASQNEDLPGTRTTTSLHWRLNFLAINSTKGTIPKHFQIFHPINPRFSTIFMK
jgi:hypothetical protein